MRPAAVSDGRVQSDTKDESFRLCDENYVQNYLIIFSSAMLQCSLRAELF